MGLPRAIKAHSTNQLDEAEIHYRRAYQQGKANEILYQNFGALLKKIGKTHEASILFEEGLKRYPNHPGIKRNYANQLRKNAPSYAVELYIDAIHLTLCNPQDIELCASCCSDLIELLRERSLLSWCCSLINYSLSIHKPSPILLKNLLLILEKLSVSDESKQVVLSAIEIEIGVASLSDAVSLDFALASHYLSNTQHILSLHHFEKGLQRVQSAIDIDPSEGSLLQGLIDTNSWNFACALLPLYQFERGWKLFDHGLRTPADGQQRWQRALLKPFTSCDLPLWRGQHDPMHRLLLLEEQAIGDCMMFLSLVTSLLSELKYIGLFISPRLVDIYKHSFAKEISQKKIFIFTKDDLANGNLKASDFDSQIPLGSICQHRFTTIDSYAPRVPVLSVDEELVRKLRDGYLCYGNQPKLLVGVSWRGGGRGARIKQKSLDVDLFAEFMLGHPHVRFVDIQYGETNEQIKAWTDLGIDIIHDPRINALKDMNSWLAQVKACDAVVSVANTTIHGAGGLNIPTQCLLSTYSDWRWLIDQEVKRSYWYPSVGIARERRGTQSSWSDAFKLVSQWLDDECPMPCGLNHLSMQ